MERVFRYTCACCGGEHEGAPGFACAAPDYYREDDPTMELNSDFCIIGEEYFFVRTVLDIPIHGFQEPFSWGVWASLSKESFGHYMSIFENPIRKAEYFGWFSNRLPFYPNTLSLKTTVHTRSKELRPWLQLEPSEHPLSVDYQNGISWDRAIEIAQAALHDHDA